MSLEALIDSWREVRSGLIKEVDLIPADKFSFRATGETRSVAEILQHIVESQKILSGESCRDVPNFMRQSFADHKKEYASEVASISDKEGILKLLRDSMEGTETLVRGFTGRWEDSMRRFDGKEMSREGFLTFAVSHEMYHRGQLTVYERLLDIEPALTQLFKKMTAQAG
jgi:uncharacterized damage-inducible protein DinB